MSFPLFSYARTGQKLGLLIAVLIALCVAGGCKPKPGVKTANADAPKKAGKDSEKEKEKEKNAEKDKARDRAAEAVPVEVATIARGPISQFLYFTSVLETEASVDVFPQITGQVEQLLVEEGKIVKAGEPLLKLDDRELQVDVGEGEVQVKHLTESMKRYQDVFEKGLINQQEYADRRFQFEQAKLRLERARLRVEYATIKAPFDGVISSRDTQVGARVSSGTKVFSIVKLDEILAKVFVPGEHLASVAEGQKAIITSEVMPNKTFEGWVKRISPVVDPKSGTFKVTVGVRGKMGELPPGIFAGVRIITDSRQSAVLIPKRAMVYEGGERYIFMVVEGKALKKRLQPGYEDPENIEALQGVDEGAQVIVLGHNGIKDGAPVRTVTPVGATAPEEPKAAATRTADAKPST